MKRIILLAALTFATCNAFASVSFPDGYDDKKEGFNITTKYDFTEVAADEVCVLTSSYKVENFAVVSVFEFSSSKENVFFPAGGAYTVILKATHLSERTKPPERIMS